MSSQNNRIFFVNAYLQHCESIEPYLHHIDKILNTLRGNNIVLCMDTNANCALWYSKCTDSRGEELEDLIAQHNLHVMNTQSDTFTFDNTHGQDNIDVTLVSNSLRNKIKNWKVLPNQTSSDHNVVTFEINQEQPSGANIKATRFNTRKADWEKFKKILIEETKTAGEVNPPDENTDVQEWSRNLEDAITKASEHSIPKKTQFTKSVPWWTPHLTELRRRAFEARHAYQRTGNEPHRQALRLKYNKTRNQYISALRKAKEES
ncbi:Retrovirus-related Pol polyprotein from type-1 retrotransposable element R1 (Fragment) [Anthophora plagiata]